MGAGSEGGKSQSRLSQIVWNSGAASTVAATIAGTRPVYFAETGFAECAVYNRYALRPGTQLRGPAVIEEREPTVVIGPNAGINVDQDLNLIVDIDGEEKK